MSSCCGPFFNFLHQPIAPVARQACGYQDMCDSVTVLPDLSSHLQISLVLSPACPSWRLGQEPHILIFTSHSLLPEHCQLHRDYSHIFPIHNGCKGNSGSHVPPAPFLRCHLTVTCCQPGSCHAGDPSRGAAGRHIS